jgi:hypothetical protein
VDLLQQSQEQQGARAPPLPSPPSPPPPDAPQPTATLQDHTPEGTSTLQRHLFLACLPAYDICDPSPGTPSCRVVLPSCAAPHERALTPVPRPPSPVSGPGSSPQCCLAGSPGRIRPAAKEASNGQDKHQNQASEISAFFFPTTRETQKGRRPRVRSFLTSRSPPRPIARLRLASRSPLSWHPVAIDDVCGEERREQCTGRISRIHLCLAPGPIRTTSGRRNRREKTTNARALLRSTYTTYGEALSHGPWP